MKKGYLLLIVLLLCVGFAFAVDPAGASVTNISNYGPINGTDSEQLNVSAGYIHEIDVVANMSTSRWAGIFGNVSGNIQLGSGLSDVMYTWTAEGLLVFASENSPTWGSLGNVTAVGIDGNYSYLGAAASDNASMTFIGSVEDIGSNLFDLNSTFATTASNGGSPWKTYALYDGSEFIYAGLVESGNQNYRGEAVDFQMIVPENGLTAGATTYGIWVELV